MEINKVAEKKTIFLELIEHDRFIVFLNLSFFGSIIKTNGMWICYPTRRIEDVDEVIKKEVDRILGVLNCED